jgi:hypothetical protein
MGCMSDPEYVGDFFLEIVSYNECSCYSDYRLTPAQRTTIDSLLLFSRELEVKSIDLNRSLNDYLPRTMRYMLESLPPLPQYYERIRSLVNDYHNFQAAPCLAKYKKIEDIPVIQQVVRSDDHRSKDFGLQAINIFPHKAFYGVVKEVFKDDEGSFEAYRAIARYKTRESRRLLEKELDKISDREPWEKRHVLNGICAAIHEFPDKIYDGLLNCDSLYRHWK